MNNSVSIILHQRWLGLHLLVNYIVVNTLAINLKGIIWCVIKTKENLLYNDILSLWNVEQPYNCIYHTREPASEQCLIAVVWCFLYALCCCNESEPQCSFYPSEKRAVHREPLTAADVLITSEDSLSPQRGGSASDGSSCAPEQCTAPHVDSGFFVPFWTESITLVHTVLWRAKLPMHCLM